MPRIPLIEDLTTGPVPTGLNILVEFDPASQWFNASLTIAAGWIRNGGTSSYNAYNHTPENVRLQLRRLGLDVEKLESEEKLRIIDGYTVQLGQKSKEKYAYDSLKVAEMSILYSKTLIPATGSPYPSTGWHIGPDVLRINEDVVVPLRFNDETNFIDFLRTRVFPSASTRNSTTIHGIAKGVLSESLYKTMEASVDGIIDLRVDEEAGEVRNLMRIRSMQSASYDTRWRRLKVSENFEVTLEK